MALQKITVSWFSAGVSSATGRRKNHKVSTPPVKIGARAWSKWAPDEETP